MRAVPAAFRELITEEAWTGLPEGYQEALIAPRTASIARALLMGNAELGILPVPLDHLKGLTVLEGEYSLHSLLTQLDARTTTSTCVSVFQACLKEGFTVRILANLLREANEAEQARVKSRGGFGSIWTMNVFIANLEGLLVLLRGRPAASWPAVPLEVLSQFIRSREQEDFEFILRHSIAFYRYMARTGKNFEEIVQAADTHMLGLKKLRGHGR